MSRRCSLTRRRPSRTASSVRRARRRTRPAARPVRARRVRRRARGPRSPRRSAGRCGRQPLRVRDVAGPRGARSGSKTRLRVCGKRSASRAMGSAGRTGSVRVASTQASSCRGEGRVGEQVLQVPADPGERRGAPGSRRARRSTAPSASEVDQPHALAVVGLGEGVRQRGAGVAHALGDGLAAVQMAERGVVDAVEDAGGHGGDSADGDVPLAVAGLAAGDEGVREDDGAGARAARAARSARTRSMAAASTASWPGLVHPELVLHQRRFEVGQPVEGDVAVGVGEQHGGAAGRRGRCAGGCRRGR